MRTSKLTAEDIIGAEQAKDDRQRSRAKGFSKMQERDMGMARLRDHSGSFVNMLWHVPDERRKEGVGYSAIPEGMFILELSGKRLVFDAEEFRRHLRWV